MKHLKTFGILMLILLMSLTSCNKNKGDDGNDDDDEHVRRAQGHLAEGCQLHGRYPAGRPQRGGAGRAR